MTANRRDESSDRTRGIDRRQFLGRAAASAAAVTIVPRHVLGGRGYVPPSDMVYIGSIGAMGMGRSNRRALAETGQAEIVALCDVDDTKTAEALADHEGAKTYRDYRRMLEEESGLDAVVVSTPDHMHAVITMAAMERGLGVYTEKPLTWSVEEARLLAEGAERYGVATQMGNWGHAHDEARLINEWIADGAIGSVREVHTWTNRPIWPQGIDRPEGSLPIPSTLDWDLWLGVAPERPYNEGYHPFDWRGWWDFGTGALGDMACHIIDFPFWALKLGHPDAVEASSVGMTDETYPLGSMVTFHFPAREGMPAVKLIWWDGGLKPPRPPELEPGRQMGDRSGGVIFNGDSGKIMCSCYARDACLIPQSWMDSYDHPAPSLPRSIGHREEWLEAVRGGQQAMSNFGYAGPLTEVILLGCVAIRMNDRLEWDGDSMTVTNLPEANAHIRRTYREGW